LEWIRLKFTFGQDLQDKQDFFERFPEENAQTLSPSAKEFLPIHRSSFEIST
jgi:hypothetical protein